MSLRESLQDNLSSYSLPEGNLDEFARTAGGRNSLRDALNRTRSIAHGKKLVPRGKKPRIWDGLSDYSTAVEIAENTLSSVAISAVANSVMAVYRNEEEELSRVHTGEGYSSEVMVKKPESLRDRLRSEATYKSPNLRQSVARAYVTPVRPQRNVPRDFSPTPFIPRNVPGEPVFFNSQIEWRKKRGKRRRRSTRSDQ